MVSIKSTKQRYLHYYRKRSAFSAFPLSLCIKRMWTVRNAPSLRGKYPSRRGEGGEEWLGGPLWSPAVLLSCVRNNAIIARCFHPHRWSKRLLRGVRACNLLVMPQFKINGSRQSFSASFCRCITCSGNHSPTSDLTRCIPIGRRWLREA